MNLWTVTLSVRAKDRPDDDDGVTLSLEVAVVSGDGISAAQLAKAALAKRGFRSFKPGEILDVRVVGLSRDSRVNLIDPELKPKTDGPIAC